jgi:hypothetical protein
MRFELYRVEIMRSNRLIAAFIVAPGKERASEIVVEHESALNRENQGFTLERVDELLPPNQRQGLDALLEGAPAGLASYYEPIGWVAHAIPAPKLKLYRIEELDGDVYFVIAPNHDIAVAVYCDGIELEEGEGNFFSIYDGLISLTEEGSRGLSELLEFGPVGIAVFGNNGWSLKE